MGITQHVLSALSSDAEIVLPHRAVLAIGRQAYL